MQCIQCYEYLECSTGEPRVAEQAPRERLGHRVARREARHGVAERAVAVDGRVVAQQAEQRDADGPAFALGAVAAAAAAVVARAAVRLLLDVDDGVFGQRAAVQRRAVVEPERRHVAVDPPVKILQNSQRQ